jgi:hypothetical protein
VGFLWRYESRLDVNVLGSQDLARLLQLYASALLLTLAGAYAALRRLAFMPPGSSRARRLPSPDP